MITSARPASLLPPAWSRRVQLLRRGAAVLSSLAVLTDLSTMIAASAALGAYLGLAVTAVGVLLTLRHPALGLIGTVGGCGTVVLLGGDPTALWTVTVFTLFSSALAGIPPFRSGLIVGTTLYLLVGLADGRGFDSAAALAAVTASAAAAGIGGGLRAQARYVGVLAQRAADAAAQAVADERLRIARDLHDLVGHEVAALNMHIGVAEITLPPGADRTAAALLHARTAVQSVLRETQQILALLRRDDTPADDSDDPGQSSPSPQQLAGLLESFRGFGLAVETEFDQSDLHFEDPAVGLTVFRVVQESLTNAHRYGDGKVTLTVIRTESAVLVTTRNRHGSRRKRASGGSGYGLIGMRERVEAVRGDLKVTDSESTFIVTATLPTSQAD